MAHSTSKLILAGKLANDLGRIGKADVSAVRCLRVFKAGPVQ